nr:helix-turn-helix domain-containing protein [uncultured Celeribacter sp.]
MSTDTETTSGGVAAVDRALKIVRFIAQSEAAPTLAALSEGTGFYKSTCLRLLASLEAAGLVTRHVDHTYGLSHFAYDLGRAYEKSLRITDVLLPLMQGMVDNGCESASFHLLRDAQTRVCLLRIDSHHSTLDRIRAGSVLPLDKGAPGKVIRNFSEDTPRIDPSAELVQVSIGERDPACGALAAPVFRNGLQFAGALSLSGPLDRFNAATIPNMTRLLKAAAEQATLALGGFWPAKTE